MRNTVFVLLVSVFAPPLLAQGAPPQGAADQPYSMEYYNKMQWGHEQEFLQLFLKNHYPLLKKEVESGRTISVRIENPANHMTEDSRWDYRVTIKYKNAHSCEWAGSETNAVSSCSYRSVALAVPFWRSSFSRKGRSR